ncbi:MAG: penicillin-binding protein 2 [Kiritimatiellales bacterium]
MQYKGRVILTATVVTALFAGLGTRLAFLHLKPSGNTLARIERARKMELEIRGPRGTVFDCNGHILALDAGTKHICVDPKYISRHGDLQKVLEAFEKHLPLSRTEIWKLLNQPEKQYVRVHCFARDQVVDALQTMKLGRGVIFEDAPVREYPKGVLAAHVIGFANQEGQGSAGIEQRLNTMLQGTPGIRSTLADGRRREIYSGRTVDIPPVPGKNIYLTIDQQIQYFTEKALDNLNEKYKPRGGACAIVQDVRTGKILAMASLPTYNLNRYNITPAEWMRNRAINFVYEPGSTMKAVIIASALDQGIVRQSDVYDCEKGIWYYGGRSLRDSHPEGLLSVADIVKKSSNIGAAKIALQMGDEKVYRSLRDFGFGTITGVGLPGEDAGIVWPVNKWSKISITRLAMGHEVLVSTIQLVAAFSAIANDGKLMKPYIVDRITDEHGKAVKEFTPEMIRTPIKPETAKQMRRLLARVTQSGGTGTGGAVPGYMVAGKTGTAQKVDLKNGGYLKNRYIASFIGFLPVENPAVCIIVVADDPVGAGYGGTVCAPYFKEIAEQAVRYLRIPPEGFPTEYIAPQTAQNFF